MTTKEMSEKMEREKKLTKMIRSCKICKTSYSLHPYPFATKTGVTKGYVCKNCYRNKSVELFGTN